MGSSDENDSSIYDDEYTRKKKYAKINNLNDNTLIYEDGNYIDLSSPNKYYQQIDYEKTFIDVASDLLESFNFLDPQDVVMSYIYQGAEDKENPEFEDLPFDEFSVIDRNNEIYYNEENIEELYNEWLRDREIAIQNNDVFYNQIQQVQNKLTTIAEPTEEDIILSQYEITDTSLLFYPKYYDNVEIKIEDGIDIFNNVVLSERIPFVRYTNQFSDSYFKVYSGSQIGDVPNFKSMDELANDKVVENTITFLIWVERTGRLSTAPNKYIVKGLYNLKRGVINLTTPIGARTLTLNQVQGYLNETFTVLNIETPQKTDVKGYFNIFLEVEQIEEDEAISVFSDLLFDYTSFIDMISDGTYYVDEKNVKNKDLLGLYLYLDESIESYSLKKFIRLSFRSLTSENSLIGKLQKNYRVGDLANVVFDLSNNKTISEEYFNLFNDEDDKISLLKGTSYVRVNIKKAISEDHLINFMHIFRILFKVYYQYYLSENNQIGLLQQAMYEEMMGDVEGKRSLAVAKDIGLNKENYNNFILLNELEDDIRKTTDYESLGDGRSLQLKNLYSDIFISDHARVCANKPIAISEDEIGEWKNRKVYKEIKAKGKSKKKNIEMERQVLSYPKDNPVGYFVCPDDDRPFIGVIKNSLINNNEYPYIPCCYPEDQQNTSKNTGYKKYYQNLDTSTSKKALKRVEISKSNIILSDGTFGMLPENVIGALNSGNNTIFERRGIPISPSSLIHCVLIALKDQNYEMSESKEEFVEGIRGELRSYIDSMKQELYDRNNEQIEEAISDPTIFLDPTLFYRSLEEHFGVNIFTFNKDNDGNIEIPRSWLFHIRVERPNNQTILIFKNTSDKSKQPHCELIVTPTEKDFDGIFDQDIYNICYNIILQKNSTLTWKYNFDKKYFNGYSDIYSNINYNIMFQNSFYEQYIDQNGKARAFNFKIEVDKKQYDVSIATPPTQPENLPIFDSRGIQRIPMKIALKVFGKNSFVDLANDKIVGLWYQLFDIQEALYVPILEHDYNGEKIGSANPIEYEKTNITLRYTMLKKQIIVILGILKWLFQIYKISTNNPNENMETFRKYFKNDDYDGDSLDYYDFVRVPYKLPYIENFKEAIKYIESLKTGLIKNGKIYGYNDVFTDQIYTFIERHSKQTEGIPGTPKYEIVDYYSNILDFEDQEDVAIFIGFDNYNKWLNRVIFGQLSSFEVKTSIDMEYALLTDPYVLKYKDNYYLVQNVRDINPSAAYNVGLIWKNHNLNSGFMTAPSRTMENYVLYGIDISNDLIILEQDGIVAENYVQLLVYGDPNETTKRYAAMLPLN
jgi:hypothetical protein